MNYLVGIVVVAVGVFFGFLATNVNDILQWIVGACMVAMLHPMF